MSVSGSEHVSDLFTECSTKIDDLYAFRDKYFLTDRTRTHADRLEDLTERLTALVTELDNIKDQLESKASYLTLLGKAHNVMPDFNQTACDSLKKATKLDPKSIEAWNYLGECYWKKRDFEMCRICFEQSLSIARNKQGLRGMSMVTRQLIDVPEGGKQQAQQVASVSKYDHIRNSLEDSIKYAKESLQLDVKDGMSWYILANCYVSKFFSPFGQQNPTLLKQAVSAYNLALKDKQVTFAFVTYLNKSCKINYNFDAEECSGRFWLASLKSFIIII